MIDEVDHTGALVIARAGRSRATQCVNGPYSVSLNPANEPEPPLIYAARNLKNSDDAQSAF